MHRRFRTLQLWRTAFSRSITKPAIGAGNFGDAFGGVIVWEMVAEHADRAGRHGAAVMDAIQRGAWS